MFGLRRPCFAERKVYFPAGLCPVAVIETKVFYSLLPSCVRWSSSPIPPSLSRTILFRYAEAEADAENHQEREGVGVTQVERQQDEGAMRALQKAKKAKANAKTDAEKVMDGDQILFVCFVFCFCSLRVMGNCLLGVSDLIYVPCFEG